MGIKVKARQTKQAVGSSTGKYCFIMQAEIYSALKQEKDIPKEEAEKSKKYEQNNTAKNKNL